MTAGVNLTSVTVGDFNGDGIPDLAVSDYVDQTGVRSNTVNVLLGNGNGSFQPPISFNVGVAPWEVVVSDFNQDGIEDLAVVGEFAGSSTNNVSVLLGNGDGTFQPAASYSTSTNPAISPFALVAGDFNGDGIPDLAVLDTGLTVLMGNGDGSFSRGAELSTGRVPVDVAAADLDGNGILDLVVTNNYDATIGVFLGNGDGSFQPQQLYGVQTHPSSVVAGDFNGDGVLDLAVANYVDGLSSTVSVLTGNGNGTFGRAVNYPAGAGAQILAEGDFNGDGAADLAIADYGDEATGGGYAGVLLAGSCHFSVTPQTLGFGNMGASQVLNVTAASPSCGWAAYGNAPWLQLSAGSGMGSGSMSAVAGSNPAMSPLSGSLLIAGQTIAVSESATPQSFADVSPSNYDYQAIYLLQQKGITSGCGPVDYCPDNAVTRAQMAVFLVRAVVGGDNFTSSPTPWFNDVQPGDFGFAWIQKLYELGITSGCGGGAYCPNASVTRAQMAVFIIRSRYGAGTIVPAPPVPYFADVPEGSFAYSAIQRMRQDNITAGCSSTSYCPTDSVTRGDMATFIMRGAFNQLLPTGQPVITKISQATLANGATATVTITGLNVGFLAGATSVIAVPGLKVGTVTVTGLSSLAVQLTGNSSNLPQPVSIWVETGSQQAVLPNALIIQ